MPVVAQLPQQMPFPHDETIAARVLKRQAILKVTPPQFVIMRRWDLGMVHLAGTEDLVPHSIRFLACCTQKHTSVGIWRTGGGFLLKACMRSLTVPQLTRPCEPWNGPFRVPCLSLAGPLWGKPQTLGGRSRPRGRGLKATCLIAAISKGPRQATTAACARFVLSKFGTLAVGFFFAQKTSVEARYTMTGTPGRSLCRVPIGTAARTPELL